MTDVGGHSTSPTVPVTALEVLYRTMVRIRRFEEVVARQYRSGEIPGFVHVSIGQEAAAAGACWPLELTDLITTTHRGHGHCIAKGIDLEAMFAELLARTSGTNRGFGGSMHIADPERGVLGANGIVAAGVPIAAGAAFATELRKQHRVVVAFIGDGAVAQGAFHEALNLASLWRLPLIVFCENNGYAEFTPTAAQHPVSLEQRAGGYGIPFTRVDGNDVREVAASMERVVSAVREGGGPQLVEAVTSRGHGHYEGDPQRYRDADERDRWRERDPLAVTRRQLTAAGVEPEHLDATAQAVDREVTEALEAARTAPEPSPDAVPAAFLSPRPTSDGSGDGGTGTFRVMDAVHDALAYELARDPDVFLAGIDVGAGGNIFGITRGLHERWPDRVRDTPISETAVMGLAVGAAMAGLRPVVELMYLDFIGVCFDQLLNQAAKLRFMSGGRSPMGLTVRTQFGAGRSSGSQHSQSLEALLAHVPGLTVVMPSTPADAYGLLRASIRDPNPVVFIEHRLLYGHKGRRPVPHHLVPIGSAAVRRRGGDVTLVSVSRMVHEALAAAETVASEGIDVEVVDLRTVAPWDRETVFASVARTTRLVIAHEAVTDFGIGAEIAASVAEHCVWRLDAPVHRVGAMATPAPYAPGLERRWLPDRERIAVHLRAVVRA